MQENLETKAQVNPTRARPQSPSLEILAGTLDAEIERVREESKRPGWSRWAIYGALAASVSLLLDQLETIEPDFSTLASILLAVALASDALYELYVTIVAPVTHPWHPRRFPAPLEMAQRRPPLFFAFSKTSALVVLSYMLFARTSQYFLLAGAVVYGLFSLLTIVIFVASYRHYPIIVHQSGRQIGAKIIDLITFLVLMAMAAWYWHFAYTHGVKLIPHIRIAGLIVAISYLISYYLRESSPLPMLNTLVGVRRDLGLGRIDVGTAIDRADTAILGLRLSDLAQADIEPLVHIDDRMVDVAKLANAELEELDRILAGITEAPSVSQKTTCQALGHSVKAHISTLKELGADRDRRMSAIKSRMSELLSESENGDPAAKELIDKLRSSVQAAGNELASMEQRMDLITNRLNRLTPPSLPEGLAK